MRPTLVTTLLALLSISCGTDQPGSSVAPRAFSFGPFALQPGQEIPTQCVSVTLDNDQPLYIQTVDLDTMPGVHHSNWFWVPDYAFDGPDGAWTCADRGFDEATAGAQFGGVLFAQSTQATHEVQELGTGVVIAIPAHARIVAGLHLLNAGDQVENVDLTLTIHPIAQADVKTVVAGLAFENHTIALPPHAKSRFTVECDLGAHHQAVLGRPVDFKIYHVLPHYHALGAGLTFEAIRDSDGGADTIWSTDGRVGDLLGGRLDPPFDMTGHSKIRFSCTFDNPRDTTVGWGVGDQEMCIVFAFTDSELTWSGGEILPGDPGPPVPDGDVIDFTAPDCKVITAEANR